MFSVPLVSEYNVHVNAINFSSDKDVKLPLLTWIHRIFIFCNKFNVKIIWKPRFAVQIPDRLAKLVSKSGFCKCKESLDGALNSFYRFSYCGKLDTSEECTSVT